MSCLLPPVCAFCQHLLNDDEQECRAFKEIPDAIMSGKCDHTEPYQGDNGLCFQLVETERETFEEINIIRLELGMPAFRFGKQENSPLQKVQKNAASCKLRDSANLQIH